MKEFRRGGRQELEDEAHRREEEFLRDFTTKDNGRDAEIFLERLRKIHDWLQQAKDKFGPYWRAKQAWEKEAALGFGGHLAPAAADLKEGARQRYAEQRKSFYENVIRDSRARKHSNAGLGLDAAARKKTVRQLGEFCQRLPLSLKDAPATFEPLLFPDETFSLSAAEQADVGKPIDYPFMQYFFTVNRLISLLDSELAKYRN